MDLIKTLLLSLGEGAIASLPVSGPPHESWLMQALGIPALPLMLHALACLCALIVWIVKSIVRKSKDRKALRREKAEAAKKEEAAKE